MAVQYPPVQFVESVISAGIPNTLQQTVAYVSFGDTNLATGTRLLVTSMNDISAALPSTSWLNAALTTLFAQGNTAVYVIELGNVTGGSQALATATLGTSTQYTVATVTVAPGGGGADWVTGNTFAFPGGTGTVTTETGGVVETVTLVTSPPQANNPAGTGIAATPTGSSVGVELLLDITSSSSQVSNGTVAAATVTTPGAGYSFIPSVVISGGGGSGAVAVAAVLNGTVTGITIINPGSGYTAPPTVNIQAPPANLGALLQDYLVSYPLQNYLYVLSQAASADPTVQAVPNLYDYLTSYTYFLLTLNAAQAGAFGDHKSAILFTPAVALPALEFSASTVAFMFSSLKPSAVARIQPFNFRFVQDATPYASASSGLLTAIAASNTNVVIPATAGGLTENMLLGGQTSDGNAINLWYGPDYASLNVTQALTNELINGSNDSINPLYYSQEGINRLVARCTQTLNSCITVGAILGPITVNSIDFATYVSTFPDDYEQGIYNGISFTIVPARGFNGITYNMSVDFTATSVSATAQ
jgi:hypothetical protein